MYTALHVCCPPPENLLLTAYILAYPIQFVEVGDVAFLVNSFIPSTHQCLKLASIQ